MTEESPEATRRCANCGAELRPNDRYCGECGLPTFVPTTPEKPPAAPPTPPTAGEPAAAPPATAPAKPAGGQTWAVITGIVLILIGLGACAMGALVWLFIPVQGGDPGATRGAAIASSICCLFPALLLMGGGGAIWYVWGRKKR